jgi:carbon-monoxide dehydrogenase medium subunit
LFLKPFRYERAGTLAEASETLRGYGDRAKAIAGGQSLLPMMHLGMVDVEAVVDITHVEGARGVSEDDGFLVIGALTRHVDLERDPVVRQRQPLLAAAARWIGSPRVRARGTIGGSLAHADPAAELPLAISVLGAEIQVINGSTSRRVTATDFSVGYFTTSLDEGELVASIRVPALGPGWGWAFIEVARRLGDFAIVAGAALVRVAEGHAVESRVGLGGVGERPIRLGAVEAAVQGAVPDELEDRIGPIDGIQPVSDASASADHRRHLARVVAIRVVREAFERATEVTA